MNRRTSPSTLAALFAATTLLAMGATARGAQIEDGTIVDRYFDCSKIYDLGIDKQTNMRARLLRIQCGIEDTSTFVLYSGLGDAIPSAPSNLGGTDVNTITGTETFPAVTQSESFVWGQGNTIVVTMNDSRTAPGNYSGGSYSTDGGTTFTRLTPSPFASGHGTNYGDPTVVFDIKLNTWYATFLATGCGGQGIGVWTSPDGVTWSTGACAHTGSSDDRQSMWVDNTVTSPFYGRMYVSWNDFAAGQGIYCVHSDDGTTWTNSTVVGSFIRNCQLTGGNDGTVFIAGMNENGGGLAARNNIMYRSTNGGVAWTSIAVGAAFAAPGSVSCGYFEAITPIWRHMGWGQPAAGPSQVIHYPYCGQGVNASDFGDIYYTRSTDNGSTWSAPIVLNSDQAGGGAHEQWMPSCSVSNAGSVLVTWYDRRNTTNGTNYEYWGRISNDNGQTWLADQPISDVLANDPAQPDPNVQSCYVGDYNYQSANGAYANVTWCDGRNQVNSTNQQDVYFDKVLLITCSPITVSPASLPNGVVGAAYSQTVTASGGTAPYTFLVTAGSLPPGLVLSSAGVLSGSPSFAGSFTFTVTATDTPGCQGSLQYTVDITCNPITLSPASLPNAIVNQTYSQTITASGGLAPYTFTVTAGSLPAGMLLNNSTGVIAGTCPILGPNNFTITATDAANCTGSQPYTINVTPPCGTITLAPATLPNGFVGTAYSQTITASGGTAPYTFAVTGGSLPTGLALAAGGVLSGTPAAAGTFNFTVTATDANTCPGTQSYTVTIDVKIDSIVGKGLGQPNNNEVRVYLPTGTATAVDFFAYSAGQWGVNVISGDVNGGGLGEILTGAGPGDVFGPQVKSFDRTGAPMGKINFYAYGTLKYGVNVGSGNLDADTYDEILSGAGPGVSFGPHVRGWNFDNNVLTAIAKISFFAYGTLKYGVNVNAGTVDSDAYNEILTGPGPGAIFGPQVRGFNFDGAVIASINKINFNAFTVLQFGANVASGDVENDGFDEIGCAPGPGAGPSFPSTFKGFNYDGGVVAQLTGYQVTAFSTFYGGRVGFGDLNMDAKEDLIAGAGRDNTANSTVKAYGYNGSTLTQLSGQYTPFGAATYGCNVAAGALGY